MIRRVSISDIKELLRICKDCFPTSPRWNGSVAFASHWWNSAILSPAAEVWVSLHNDDISGFYVLVINEDVWNREKRQRCGKFITRLLALISCPLLAMTEIRKRSRRMMIRLIKKSSREFHSIPNADRSWIELMAVSTNSQGMGYAKRLMNHCEERSMLSSKFYISLLVDTDNIPARKLYEKHGYTFCIQGKYRTRYEKHLEEIENTA